MPQYQIYYNGPRAGETTFWSDDTDPLKIAQTTAERHLKDTIGEYWLDIFRVSLEDFEYHFEFQSPDLDQPFSWKKALVSISSAYEQKAKIYYISVDIASDKKITVNYSDDNDDKRVHDLKLNIKGVDEMTDFVIDKTTKMEVGEEVTIQPRSCSQSVNSYKQS
jgi:hypothetical protein